MKIRRFKKGITLIEAVVGMAIFVTVVTVAVGGFVALVRLQRKSLIMRETQQNGRIALEIIAKDARQATTINSITSTSTNSSLNITTPSGIVIISWDKTNLVIMRTPPGGSTGQPITTSGNLKVSSLTFTRDGGNLLRINMTVQNSTGGSANVYDQDTTDLETTVILEGLTH